MGYHLHLEFAPDWEALANSFFLYDNWHLLWYGALAAAVLGRRQLLSPQVAPLTMVVAGGVIFVAFVLLFTNARNWLSDQSTVNRATLHMAPVVAIWMLAVFRAWTETLRVPVAPPEPAPEAAAPPTEVATEVATEAPPPDVPPPAPAAAS
jgi:hypothetical protein